MAGEDVLSFVHTTKANPEQGGAATPISQIAINGVLLDRHLKSLDLDEGAASPDTLDMMSTPLQMIGIPIGYRVAFLDALRGEDWSYDDLQQERVPVAFCAHCLDSSCGHMWSAALIMTPATVIWRALGWEIETSKTVGPSQRRWFTRGVASEFAGWVPAPFRPEVEFTFAREEYEATILREIEYQGWHPSPE